MAEAPIKQQGNGAAFALVGIVLMLILPLPSFILDMLLTISVTLSLIVFLLAINFGDPLEFSSFPSVLLVTTIFRLSLNIASTRLILLHGHEGVEAAGSVIQAFGAFVVGGNYVVGVVVFIILVIINFKVITEGAGRISEVAARFTLDAMPGKQMAIDNDLANGHITDEVARARRKAVADEADFYGAMDGANKFVKGDAVAGLIITAINVIGGIIIAVGQQGMTFADAAETYTILTVGDGLVSQIPALLVSVAAGLIASRTASGSDLGSTLVAQLFSRKEPLLVTSGVLAFLAIIPGMPTIAFLALSGGTFALARRIRPEKPNSEPDKTAAAAKKTGVDEEAPLEDLLNVDLLALEVGFDLVPLVDRKRGGELLQRIAGVRRQLVPELGIIVPPIHIRDNLQLGPSTYRLMLSGTSIGEGELKMGRVLAINPGSAMGEIRGDKTKDPAFGMPALWISTADRERAELLGYTVVDPATVGATHLTELLRAHAGDLLGRAEAQQLIDAFARTNQKLVEEVIPNMLPLGEVIKVLRALLREGISVRDLRTILEALADHAATIKDPAVLTELVRQKMARQLTSRYRDGAGAVRALVLGPDVEFAFRGQNLRPAQPGAPANSAPGPVGLDPALIPRVVRGLESAIGAIAGLNTEPVLLTSPDIRRAVAHIASRHAPGLAVLSFNEIDPAAEIKTLAVVKLAA